MRRAIDIAKRAGKYVKSNPQVGAVILYKNRIIGEGWHKTFGQPHAEINAIASVANRDKQYLSKSVLFISLEPCNSMGKTGPCAEAILEAKIPTIVVASIDPSIHGASLDYLESKGVKVIRHVERTKAEQLLKAFKANHQNHRPFVMLKYAQSSDFFIGKKDKQIWLSNQYVSILTHRWRSESDGILIGVNTLNTDNPRLTTRHHPGENPTPIIIDPNRRANTDSHLYACAHSIFASAQRPHDQVQHCLWDPESESLADLLRKLYEDFNLSRILVEGGRATLQSFIDQNLWDECRVITTAHRLHSGIKAPMLKGVKVEEYHILDNRITHIQPS